MELTSEEQALAEKIGFDREILIDLKTCTQAPILQAPRYTAYGEEEPDKFSDAIISTIAYSRKTIAINDLKDWGVKERGYYPFLSTENHGRGPDSITILKTTDPYDVLRYKGTNGANHDIFTDTIIEKLQKWEQLYGLEIIGADTDWVSFLLKEYPEDLMDYAQEVYEFCPDTIEQGFESVEMMATAISYNRYMFLWWD